MTSHSQNQNEDQEPENTAPSRIPGQTQNDSPTASHNPRRLAAAIAGTAIAAGIFGAVLGHSVGAAQTASSWSERMAQQQEAYTQAMTLAVSAARQPAATLPQQPNVPQPPPQSQERLEPSTVRITASTQPSDGQGSRPTGATFQATTLDGEEIDLEAHRGNVTLLAFWTPW